jgi:hypothetical protein
MGANNKGCIIVVLRTALPVILGDFALIRCCCVSGVSGRIHACL